MAVPEPRRSLVSVRSERWAWKVDGTGSFERGECARSEPRGGDPIGPRSAASAERMGRRGALGMLTGRVGGDGFLTLVGESDWTDGSIDDESTSSVSRSVASPVSAFSMLSIGPSMDCASTSSESTNAPKSVSLSGGAGAEGERTAVMGIGGRDDVARVGAVDPESRPGRPWTGAPVCTLGRPC